MFSSHTAAKRKWHLALQSTDEANNKQMTDESVIESSKMHYPLITPKIPLKIMRNSISLRVKYEQVKGLHHEAKHNADAAFADCIINMQHFFTLRESQPTVIIFTVLQRRRDVQH